MKGTAHAVTFGESLSTMRGYLWRKIEEFVQRENESGHRGFVLSAQCVEKNLYLPLFPRVNVPEEETVNDMAEQVVKIMDAVKS